MRSVAVFCPNFLNYSQTFIYDELLAHRRYSAEVFAWRRRLAGLFPFPNVHIGGLRYGFTRKSRDFDAAFRSRKFDLVHAHFGTAGVYALPYAKKFGLPLVVTFHGYDVAILRNPWKFTPPYWPCAWWGPDLLRDMTLGLCASEDLRAMLLDMGMPAQKLTVHRLGIEVSRFSRARIPSSTARVTMVGRFVEKKGFEYGLRAFAAVAQEYDELQLSLIGSGPLEARLRKLSNTLGIADRVHFKGVLAPSQVKAALSESDVLLAPSVVAPNGDRDSGLIVVKEASASHVVPIGTHHGGIPDIIDDGVTGYLVPETDWQAMADRLRYLVRDPESRQRMASAARAKMEREYDIEYCNRALESLYDQAIANGRALS